VAVADRVLELPRRSSPLAVILLAAVNVGVLLGVSGVTVGDVVAPLTGHFIAIGVAAGVAILLRRWMLPIILAGSLGTLAVHALLGLAWCCAPATPNPARTGLASAVAAGPQAMSLVALNAWDGNRDLARLERYLASAPADVLVLAEFGPDKRPMLARLQAAYPHQIDCADAWPCSLALLSRLPLEAAGTGRVTSQEPRGMPHFIWAKIAGITLVGTHLHRPSRNPWLHERQATALARFLRRIDGPLVLAGDLNTTPWSASYRMLRRMTGLNPARALVPTWPAWPLPLPQVALDHILASPDVAYRAAGAGPAVGSDHLPVWALIERRPVAIERRQPGASRLAAAGAHFGGEFLGNLGGEHVGAGYLRR
jgi:endonuclease/exonuclease/phosphatase (EEP) superfamily protein YafD